jgi:uncharacterized protein (TIGR02145 family)
MKKNVIIFFIFILFFSCNKYEAPTAAVQKIPVLSTIAVTNITKNSAYCGGNMTSDGGTNITVRGICWSSKYSPTIADSKTTAELGTDIFISSLTGLAPNTAYFVRAYATNSIGTGYGNTVTFVTGSSTFTSRFGGTVQDIDGNVYHTDTIGIQVWMVENLKTTRYRNGESIPTDNTAWETSGAYSNYNDNISNGVTYGRMYNWNAVNDKRGLAPAGWHVATDSEWIALVNYLEGLNVAGGKLKEAGTTHWLSPNTGATNETGFTALPGGFCGGYGVFSELGTYGMWWTSTEVQNNYAYYRTIFCDGSYISSSYILKRFGLSVRCVKD